ncbi:hypothetical protein [Nonomuraea sp. NPDC050691]|uniref:hypothetical protein n=1 Tax=Nonomuraea sp. NPDC050691 TaxID=3155661 RepID=UPI0033EA69BF
MIGIPVSMDAKNLQAFIDEDLRHGSKKWNPYDFHFFFYCKFMRFRRQKKSPRMAG